MKIKLIAFLFLFNTIGFAQNETEYLTGEEIIQNAIEKTGGLKKLENIKSIEATFEIQTSDNQLSYMSSKSNNNDEYFSGTIPLSMDNKSYSRFVIFNKDEAVMGAKDKTRKLNDKKNLENIQLMGFASLELGYLKLGFDFERIEDETINNIECYVVLIKSPNGNNRANFYNKKTGLLLMSSEGNGGRTIYKDYVTKNGILVPSLITDIPGDSQVMVKRTLKEMVFNKKINPQWFKVMKEGDHQIPERFKKGVFKDKTEKGVKIERENIAQTNILNGKKKDLLLKWLSGNDYLLVESSESGNSKPKSFKKVNVISWENDKYFYQYVDSDRKGGTSIMEKVE